MIPARRRKKRKTKAAKVDRRVGWQQAATAAGGVFVPGGKPAKDKVIVEHGPWEVWLDTYVVSNGQTSVTYTRARAYFMGWRGMTLRVRRRNIFDRLMEALGFGSRPSLGRALTDKYVVKGKPPPRLPSLFSGSYLSERIMAVPSLSLQVKKPGRKSRRKWGPDVGVVTCQTTGVAREVETLVGLIEVTKEALDGLHRIGEATDDPLAAASTQPEGSERLPRPRDRR